MCEHGKAFAKLQGGKKQTLIGIVKTTAVRPRKTARNQNYNSFVVLRKYF